MEEKGLAVFGDFVSASLSVPCVYKARCCYFHFTDKENPSWRKFNLTILMQMEESRMLLASISELTLFPVIVLPNTVSFRVTPVMSYIPHSIFPRCRTQRQESQSTDHIISSLFTHTFPNIQTCEPFSCHVIYSLYQLRGRECYSSLQGRNVGSSEVQDCCI